MTWLSVSPDLNPIEPLEYFKEEGRATKLFQQRATKKNHLWKMAQHLSTDLDKTGIIPAQEDPICHKK